MSPRAARWVCSHTWHDLRHAINLRFVDGHPVYDELRMDGHKIIVVAHVWPVLPDHHVSPRRRRRADPDSLW